MPAAFSAYLAGPDVFAPDAAERFAEMRSRCMAGNVEPICPIDEKLPDGLEGKDLARRIKAANVDRVREAACVIANISPFRGPNMDPGTAYEIGYAEALGKPVFLWSETAATLADRTPAASAGVDAQGWTIEDFGLAENLMIAVTDYGPVATSFTEALSHAQRHFGSRSSAG